MYHTICTFLINALTKKEEKEYDRFKLKLFLKMIAIQFDFNVN